MSDTQNVVIGAPMTTGQVFIDIHQLPDELKSLPHWCIAAPDKSPYTVSGHRANVTAPHTWADFDSVVEVAAKWGEGSGMGLVLEAGAGYVCIDLDVKDDTAPETLARFNKIIQSFDSYTERSTSGRGFHIWLRGAASAGHRRDGVEVYSQERFIVCTGNVYLNKPIREAPELLALLLSEMQTNDTKVQELTEVVPVDDDAVVWQRACTAENADKFKALCGGDWRGMGYPSQSEADLSLLSMLAFYSKSNEQVRRMFRQTELGQRPKATRNDTYLNRTLTIIRGRQERDEQFHKAAQAQSAELVEKLMATSATQGSQPVYALDRHPQTAPASRSDAHLPWPPGGAGNIAKFIYSAAMRPVQEIAIVAALGLLAGVCGKRWVIPKSGLNLYLVLLARSGVGKEALHEGISMFIRAAKARQPEVEKLFEFSDYASGPALTKALAEKSSCLQVSSEFGRRLKHMTEPGNSALQSLRTAMTKLYSKSGPEAFVGGIAYSDQEKNVKSANGIAYSMVGDSTPGTFREALTQDMMEDGFMSRFTVIEYDGERPSENPNPQAALPECLTTWFSDLVAQSISLERNNKFQLVNREPGAEGLLGAFNLECDANIKQAGEDESRRQMWNRAHLKALRIAALLAVADNYLNPTIGERHAEWAISIVRRDVSVFSSRLQSGDIGSDDKSREDKVLSLCREYLIKEPSASYKVKPVLRQNHIIPRKYLTVRTASLPAFKSHKQGSTTALEQTLRSLCSNGYITKCAGPDMVRTYNEHGECYMVLDLPAYE